MSQSKQQKQKHLKRQRQRQKQKQRAGTQPDPQDYGHDSSVKEYGVYYGRRALPGASGHASS